MPTSPLHSEHERSGARFIDFHDWHMPVMYRGIVDEHRATREAAGLFDVSHLTRLLVTGAEALPFLQRIMTNDIEIARAGKAVYSVLCNESGGVMDDCYVYPYTRRKYVVMLNAATAEKDLAWFEQHRHGHVELEDLTIRTGGLALQGPRALEIAESVLGADAVQLGYREFKDIAWQGEELIVSMTGYTGEPGVECFGPSSVVPALWRAFLQAGQSVGLMPAGLGARDTLRLEMGYALYGVDVDEQHTPFEAGLERAVNFGKASFLGRDVLARQQEQGVSRRLVGMVVLDRGIARHGYAIEQGGETIGVVTSGTMSPTLEQSIALGYVPADVAVPGAQVEIVIHNRRCRAEVVKLPFYRPRKASK